MSSTTGMTGESGPKAKLSSLLRATRLGQPTDADGAWRELQGRFSDQRRSRTRRVWFAIPTFALAAVGLFAVVWTGHPTTDPSIKVGEVGRAFESADGEVALALPDGIQVELDRRSRVRLETVTPEEIRVALAKGSARFEVTPRHPRRFVVDADDVEVRVVGTRFRVTRIEAEADEAARIEIAVERGIVEVGDRRHGGEPHRLRAGERFSMPARSASGEESAPAAPAAEPALPVREATPARKVSRHASARTLLEDAQVEWRAGRMTEAAALYEEVLAHHAADPRAALAALELGRIQMDHLSNPSAAVVSLNRALKLGPRASFREDALARLAQAYARLGRGADCRHARDAYARAYANGIHAATVSKLCE